MKAVILAAGQGSRLGNLSIPKPLTLLFNGKTIMQQQLAILEPWFVPSDIIVVVGFRQEMIRELFPMLTFVENKHFAEENTAKSLLRAFRDLDDDILWLNGDVICHPEVIFQVLKLKHNTVVVTKTEVGAEEIKYHCDIEGKIIALSKKLSEALGEAVGINKIMRNDLPTFRQQLELCSDQDYFEKGMEKAIALGVKFWPYLIRTDYCIEIDFVEDIERANALLASWNE